MELVIDAQVIKGYFEESVLGRDSSLTGQSCRLCDRLGQEDQVFLDDKGQIEYEWRNLVDSEWFDPWYANMLRDGGAFCIAVSSCTSLRKQLQKLGFPNGSRDIWYIRAAKAVAQRADRAILVTEDLDFYDPKHKAGTSGYRLQLLRSGDGAIAQHLRKKEGIHVTCVATYVEEIVLNFDRITFDPKIMAGRPCIRGIRVTVSLIVNLVANGMTTDEILEAYPYLEAEDIRQALAYAATCAKTDPCTQ